MVNADVIGDPTLRYGNNGSTYNGHDQQPGTVSSKGSESGDTEGEDAGEHNRVKKSDENDGPHGNMPGGRHGDGHEQSRHDGADAKQSAGFCGKLAAIHRCEDGKKRRQNRKRYLLAARLEREGGPQPQGETAAPIVHHVRLIVSLIERRPVSLDEILRMLKQKERQHRMGRGREPSYGLRRIHGRGS